MSLGSRTTTMRVLVALVTLLASSSASSTTFSPVSNLNVTIKEIGVPQEIDLAGIVKITMKIPPSTQNESDPVVYYLFEIHSWYATVYMAWNITRHKIYRPALDDGVVVKREANATEIVVWMRVPDISVFGYGILLVRNYTANDPVPGLGRKNHSAILDIKPNVRVDWDKNFITARFWEAGNFDQEGKNDSAVYKYQVYRYWFGENMFDKGPYFKGIKGILFKEDIESKGVLVKQYFLQKDEKTGLVTIKFPTFANVAQIFAVVVSRTIQTPDGEKTFSSVYSMGVTSGCIMHMGKNPIPGRPDFWECTFGIYTESKGAAYILMIAGFTMGVSGHRNFVSSNLWSWSFLCVMLAYPVVELLPIGHLAGFVILGFVAAGGGFLGAMVWIHIAMPLFSASIPISLFCLLLGLIPAHIMERLQYEAMMNPSAYFGTVFGVGILCYLILIRFPLFSHMMSTLFLGMFLLLFGFDLMFISTTRYIVMNFLRRMYVKGYNSACFVMPFHDSEIFLMSCACVLLLPFLKFQIWVAGGLRPFPDPMNNRITDFSRPDLQPWGIRVRDALMARLARSRVTPVNVSEEEEVGEQDPLIASQEAGTMTSPSVPRLAPPQDVPPNNGEVVGFVQGYGAVTTAQAAVAAGPGSPFMRAYQDPRFYADRDIKRSPSKPHKPENAKVQKNSSSPSKENHDRTRPKDIFRPPDMDTQNSLS